MSFSVAERDKGCQDIRSAFISVMQELTRPEAFLAKQIAEIQVQADMQNLIDGKLGEGLSEDRKSLYYLLKDFTKLYMDLQDMRLKYGIGEKKNIEVTHRFEADERISIKKVKKESKDN